MEGGKIKRPTVSYISPVDPILDAVKSKLGTKIFKVSLLDGTIVYHAVYDSGSNEAFMIHVQEVMNFCKLKGFCKSYKKAKTNLVDCTTRFNNSQKTLINAIADRVTSADRKKALKVSLDLATTAVETAEKTISRRGKHFFPFTRRS